MKRASTIIIIAAIYQVVAASHLHKTKGFEHINSLLFLAGGLAIAFCLLRVPALRFNYDPSEQLPAGWKLSRTVTLFLQCAVLLLLCITGFLFTRPILAHTPISIEHADMLPVIRVMDQRFMAGQWQQVYNPISEIWNGVQPVYLPAMWMPFMLPVQFNFDMRWITLAGILCAT
ncbi:MAG: hypothetical protein EOO88_61490, partial [Pedobacter sp.]